MVSTPDLMTTVPAPEIPPVTVTVSFVPINAASLGRLVVCTSRVAPLSSCSVPTDGLPAYTSREGTLYAPSPSPTVRSARTVRELRSAPVPFRYMSVPATVRSRASVRPPLMMICELMNAPMPPSMPVLFTVTPALTTSACVSNRPLILMAGSTVFMSFLMVLIRNEAPESTMNRAPSAMFSVGHETAVSDVLSASCSGGISVVE